jgi:hypothetical protein
MLCRVDPLSLEPPRRTVLGRVRSWACPVLRHVRTFTVAAGLIIASLSLCAFTKQGRAFVGSLNEHLNPASVQLPEPANGIPTEQLASINTLNRGVFRAFIQMHNKKIYDRLQDEIIDSCIANANKYRLSPILVFSLIQVESEFNINATSSKGAVGLTQVNPHEWLEVLIKKNIVTSLSDCYDPRKNVEAGCFILRYYLDETHNFELALDRYLGTRSDKYRDDVYKMVRRILMLGITSEINAPYRSIAPGSDAQQKWN